MLTVRCPICDRLMEVSQMADWPSFPFCSKKCRTIDLGRWLDGRYQVAADDDEMESAPSIDDELHP